MVIQTLSRVLLVLIAVLQCGCSAAKHPLVADLSDAGERPDSSRPGRDAATPTTRGEPVHRTPRSCGEKPDGWIRRPLPESNSGPTCGSPACDEDDAGITARCVDDIRLNVPTCLIEDCYSDTDCQSSAACLCGTETQVSRCVSANCRSDADCSDFACSPTYGCVDQKYGYWGYYCHTPRDSCATDEDCGRVDGSFCGYDLEQKLWRCQKQTCFGRQT
jgi:hypothetical protein